jgi:SAM-dependent methyltransferase
MSFDVSADAYGRFMGRWSEPLAEAFLVFAGVTSGRVLDVGCGPGALTERLVGLLGEGSVSAVDPSEPFVAAVAARFPEVDVRRATAEDLPFPDADAGFDACLAQLVVHFMSDPVAGLAEMSRVTRPGGVVAACVWDHAGDGGPVSLFWRGVRDLDPAAPDESGLAGAREGHLAELARAAGLVEVGSGSLSVTLPFATYDDWWRPFTLGVGPAGGYVAGLDDAARDALRAHCAALLPSAPFELTARAWVVRAVVAGG